MEEPSLFCLVGWLYLTYKNLQINHFFIQKDINQVDIKPSYDVSDLSKALNCLKMKRKLKFQVQYKPYKYCIAYMYVCVILALIYFHQLKSTVRRLTLDLYYKKQKTKKLKSENWFSFRDKLLWIQYNP